MDELVTPQWDLGDRLRKSAQHAGLELHEMAAHLGVSRNSVSNWVNGKNRPSMPALRVWAMRAGVPFEWLRDGDVAAGPGEGAGVRRPGICPPAYSDLLWPLAVAA